MTSDQERRAGADAAGRPDGTGGARRPGGRTALVREAVFAAALEELVDSGYAALSIPAIASRAGVHRTTLYRRWRTRDALLVAALDSLTADPVIPTDSGDLALDLEHYAEGIVAVLTGGSGRILHALLASDASAQPELADVKRRLFASRRRLSAGIIDRAVARGDIPRGSDASDAIDFLVAPLYFRLLLSDAPLDDALARQTAAATAAAARAGAFVPSG